MNNKITRREFIIGGAVLAIAAGLPLRTKADSTVVAGSAFEFIAVNDVHFTDTTLCPPWFEKIFEAMKVSAPQAEFVFVSGDLTQDARVHEFAGLKEMWSLLKIPVYVVPGNHDVGSDGNYEVYDKFYSGMLNYHIQHKGWNIFNLNSAESRAAENTNIPKETFKWLDDNLKKIDPLQPCIISTHFPLGPGIVRRPKNADELLKKFRHFNIQAVFNGHWHGYTQTLFKDAYITTDRCCSRFRNNYDGSKHKGWFVCRAENGQITRRFVSAPEELL